MSRNNNCFVVGNLGMDPVERARGEKSGAIVGFSVAENEQSFDPETKQYKTVHTNWFHVTAFGSTADRVKRHLKKGDRVAVQGRMKVTKYTDKSGTERNGFEIIADEIALWKPIPSAQSGQSVEESRVSEENLPF